MRTFLTLTMLLFVFVACDKPQSEPEKMDPIYDDLLKEEGKVKAALSAASKELEGFEKDLAAVAPQTGQVKYAQKRVYETRARIEKLKQAQQYWSLRAETRKKWAREKYLAAFREKKSWPPPKEWEEYKIQRKLEVAPRNWSIQQRMEQSKLGISFNSEKPPGEPEEKKGHD
ncbi:MAG: hypothetical protein ACAH59_01195 [Pseudobdellovibrionaceae bacterium]